MSYCPGMRGTRIAAAAALVSFFVFASAPASAETDSWAAAKGLLPENPYIVLGLNVSTIKSSTLFQQLYPMLLQQSGEAKEGLDQVTKSCGIDAVAVVTDVTVVVEKRDGEEEGLILVGVKGINEAKTLACLKKIAKKEKKVLTAKKMGKIIELSIKGEPDHIYMAWLTKNVVAFATEPDDKALLTRMIGGKGATGDFTAVLAKVDTSAAAWMAMAEKQPVGSGGTMSGAYGSIKLDGGVIAGEANLVMGSAAEAKKMVAEANKELAQGASQMPANIAKLLKSVTVTSADATVVVKTSIPESEVSALVGLMMAM